MKHSADRKFDLAQTFFLPKEKVRNSKSISISSVELYFRSKPKSTNNKSGILDPGVTLFLATTENSIPSRIFRWKARAEYGSIKTSRSSLKETKFTFEHPITVESDKEYALLIDFDGSDDFLMWTSVKGHKLIGSNIISPGPSGPNVGNFYEWNGNTTNKSQIIDDTSDITFATNETLLSSNKFSRTSWKPINNVDLKFKVLGYRYTQSNSSVTEGTDLELNFELSSFGEKDGMKTTFYLNSNPLEYLIYDKKSTNRKLEGLGGSLAYQNTVFHPGSYANGSSTITISVNSGNSLVTANTRYSNGSLFDWNTIFNENDNEYIVVHSLNHNGGNRKTNIRKVSKIISNRVISCEKNFNFSNSGAYFSISPVGEISYDGITKVFGKNEELLILKNSSSNSSVKFVNNTIETFTLHAGGTGYSNSDILHVIGFENVSSELIGGYKATANLLTNSIGGIINLYFSNVGCGFVNTSDIVYVISNSTSNNITSNTSSGASANISFTSNASIRTEFGGNNNFYKGIIVSNIPVSDVIPSIEFEMPKGTSYKLYHQYKYITERTSNTISGFRYRHVDSVIDTRKRVLNNEINYLPSNNIIVMPSKSNEYNILYSNGSVVVPTDSKTRNANNASCVIECFSNNDFSHIKLINPDLIYRTNIINNDDTNEHTDQGNSYCRHIVKQFNFTRTSEDLICYITAYKPVNSDIQVYARIYNSKDTTDSFDDKIWTKLETEKGNNEISSISNLNDYKEFTYTIPSYPSSNLTFNGTISTSLNNNEINGSNSNFTNAVSGDLIRIYNPLFSETNWMIAVVNTVTNATHMTLDSLITNNGIVGTGLKMERISLKNSAFRNILSDNVVTYYNSTMSDFEGYDTMAVKIVLLSDNLSIVPRVDDIRIVGTSA